MQCPRFLCTIFLSISMIAEIPLASQAVAVAQDPDPVLSFEHKKGGYGDYLAAVFAARTDDSDMASRLYHNVLSLRPTDNDLRRITFYHSVLAGNDIAVQLAKTQKDPVADLIMANDAILKGQWQDAYRYVSRPPMDMFSQMTYPLLQAWCLYGEGNKDQALAMLIKNSQGKPLSALYTLHTGIMYSLAKDDDKAGAYFERANKSFPGEDMLLTQTYGNWLIRHHRAGKAEAMVGNLVKNLPFLQVSAQDIKNDLQQFPLKNTQQAIAQVYLAMASLLQQDIASQPPDSNIDQKLANRIALHTEQIFLRLALKLNPDLSSAKMMLSGILAQEKNFEAAKDVLLPIAVNDPLKTVMQLRVARLNALLDHNEQAEKEIKTLIQDYPLSADIRQALADLYFDQKQYQKAAETYSKVLELTQLMDSSVWPVFFARAASYEKLNQWDKAEKDLKQALVFAPNEPMLLNFLGYSWILKGKNTQEAQEILQKAVDIAPEEGAIRDSLGWAMLVNNQLDDAVKQLELAAETIPQDPELNYHLGVAYWKTGRHQEAINQWNVALTCSPTPEEKELILNALQSAKENKDITVITPEK
ncbi:Flp pilus assembly protein TadD [Commensalibacter communis]|uniref:Contains TPR repeats (TadD) n=1 Tax=Commensalibacter communis TaxID=2972786 RepID=A0A9W4TMD8_9PROT|nr:tetratricopeptide repeat protein [Commensalibacter communis]CAI3922140.1 Flp pilus assembly protein TadD [Commensalibacter communis]CAI3922684.1 Flp pilus assembly protein TadD [Commensalibacter communis]CAI3939990.1 Flp pilus assembly protein TadD [Commensalibacter communis]CAI3940560.1 Flp pilus assembly protein TadD [Commensalibacter communis]